MTTTVRLADPRDEASLMDLCRMLHKENGMFPLDERLVRDMLWQAFNKQGGTIGVIGEPGDLKGMIYLLISHFWYSSSPHLEELFNFVRPDCRRSSYAKDLIAFAQACSTQIGVPLVIGIVSNTRTEAKVRLYRRVLGDPAGAFFLFNQPEDAAGLRH